MFVNKIDVISAFYSSWMSLNTHYKNVNFLQPHRKYREVYSMIKFDLLWCLVMLRFVLCDWLSVYLDLSAHIECTMSSPTICKYLAYIDLWQFVWMAFINWSLFENYLSIQGMTTHHSSDTNLSSIWISSLCLLFDR